MPEAETEFFERAVQRIFRSMLVIGTAGVLVAFGAAGWRAGIGFFLGAVGSYFNFYWLHRTIEALDPGGARPSKWLLLFIALRYLILGFGGYAIVKIFGLSITAVLVGFFVAVAAVIFEILYELTYAGT